MSTQSSPTRDEGLPNREAPSGRGRPKDPSVDRAILAATAEILTRVGYSRLRVDDVARAAGCGLGALYRRWPTRRALVLASLTTAAPDADLPVTDDAVADYRHGLQRMASGLDGPLARLLSGVLSEMQDDAELAEAVRDDVLASLWSAHRERLRRLVGDIDDLDDRADVAPALLMFRALVMGRPVHPDEVPSLMPLFTGESGDLVSEVPDD
ncbi:MAG: TetR/AcrR family transcriptional regulator [Dermatophilaceae bacterium]